MKKLLFAVFATSFLLMSCGGPSAVEFNDAIVNEEVKLSSYLEDIGTKLGEAISTSSEADIKSLSDSLISKVDQSVAFVNNLKTPSGGEKFKEAAIAYFESAKGVTELADMGSLDTPEAQQAFIDKYNSILENISEKNKAVSAAQQEFAKEKGMEVR